MSLQGIKLITFDATNTLLKFRMPPWQYYAIVARDYGFKGNEGEIKSRLLDNYSRMWEKYPNFGRCSIRWDEWWRQVVLRTFEGLLPVRNNVICIANKLIEDFKTTKCWGVADGGHKVIEIIEKKQISIGVISNFDPRLNEVLQNVGLLKKFKFVITSYESGFSKPDDRIFKQALSKCEILTQPNEALHIGDDLVKDYEGARTAGWHALLVTNKMNSETPSASFHVFNSLEDLCIVIERDNLKL